MKGGVADDNQEGFEKDVSDLQMQEFLLKVIRRERPVLPVFLVGIASPHSTFGRIPQIIPSSQS